MSNTDDRYEATIRLTPFSEPINASQLQPAKPQEAPKPEPLRLSTGEVIDREELFRRAKADSRFYQEQREIVLAERRNEANEREAAGRAAEQAEARREYRERMDRKRAEADERQRQKEADDAREAENWHRRKWGL